MTTLDQRPNFFDSIWRIWVQFVEVIDRRKFLSVDEWLYVLNILEDSNRDLNISYISISEILEMIRSQKSLLKRLKDAGDGDIPFPITMSRPLFEICLQLLHQQTQFLSTPQALQLNDSLGDCPSVEPSCSPKPCNQRGFFLFLSQGFCPSYQLL